jgi:hypothetical protein
MRRFTRVLIFIFLAACSRRRAEPPPAEGTAAQASCDGARDRGVCLQFALNEVDRGEAYLTSACLAAGGKFAAERCPLDGRVQTCHLDGGRVRHYYGRGEHPYSAKAASQDCRDIYHGHPSDSAARASR